MDTEAYSNKHLLIWCGCGAVVISVLVALCPLLWDNIKWDSSIIWAGTLCSLFGIALAISQIYGVVKSTVAVKNAVVETKHDIDKVFSVGDFAKYYEIVKTISEDIQAHDYKLASRSMQSLRDALNDYKELSLDEIQEFKSRISDAVMKIGSDIEYIQIDIQGGIGFDPDGALRNLNKIQQLLSEIKAKLKHR